MIDKSKWGSGPWQDEPDELEWQHAGFDCSIHRSDTGALCGYVACPPGHPFHGVHRLSIRVEVHGGLTFAAFDPGDPERYLIGFDCGHAFDDKPGLRALVRQWQVLESPEYMPRPLLERLFGTYRTLSYVQSEVESLAEQARAAADRLLS